MQRILLIAVPGIGDAFLATPLLGALKHAYPDARIDMLVRDGKAILEGNPYVSRVLVQPRRPPLAHSAKFLTSIFRRYDLAVSTSPSDRSFINLLFAAPRRVGKVTAVTPKTWWKRWLVDSFVLIDPEAHVVSENLRLADALGIERQYLSALPQSLQQPDADACAVPFRVPGSSFAVVHMTPGAAIRQWPVEHWRVLIQSLRTRGLAVVATGGGSEAERGYVEGILSGVSGAPDLAPVCNFAGKLEFREFVELARHAALFIGVDTSSTHVAAATGIPVVALFGSTDPVRWGPWPMGLQHSGSPWNRDELVQAAGNVTLLRAWCSCNFPHRACRFGELQPAACMSRLLPEAVLAAVDGMLHRRNAMGLLG